MTTFRRNLALASLLPLFLLVPARAHAGPTNTLAALKSKCDNDRLAIGVKMEQRRQDSLKQYGKSLDVLLAALKKKGDLEAYLVVDSEIKRLATENNVAEASDSIPALANAVQAYRKSTAAAGADGDRQAAVLMNNYAAALDALIKQLTQADRIEEAKTAMAERTSIVAELAELKSKMPQGSKPDQVSEPKRPKVPPKNIAGEATVKVNRSPRGNGLPAKVNDGETDDAGQSHTSYWYAGDFQPKPDWVRLQFEKEVEVTAIRILLPIGTIRFGAGHAPADYEVVGLTQGQSTVLATVKNEKHPKKVRGPIKGTQWSVVELRVPKVLDALQLTCTRTTGQNHGPVIFEIEVMGRHL